MKIVSPGVAVRETPLDYRRSRLGRLTCAAVVGGWALTMVDASLQDITIARNAWLLAAVGIVLGLTWGTKRWEQQSDRSLQVLLAAASLQAIAAALAFDHGAAVAWPFALIVAVTIGKVASSRSEVAGQLGLLVAGTVAAAAVGPERGADAIEFAVIMAAVCVMVAGASRLTAEVSQRASEAREVLGDLETLHHRLAATVAADPQRFAVLTMDVQGMNATEIAEFQLSLAQHVRGEDLVARSSSEGFSIIADTDAMGAMALARRIENTMAKYRQEEIGELNSSIGIAMYPEDGRTPNELLASADAALAAASRVSSPLSGD
jgi:Flp pilus assembly pilin Flp